MPSYTMQAVHRTSCCQPQEQQKAGSSLSAKPISPARKPRTSWRGRQFSDLSLKEKTRVTLRIGRRRAIQGGLNYLVWRLAVGSQDGEAAESAADVAARQAAAVAEAQAEQAKRAKEGAERAKAAQAANVKQAEADQARDVAKAEADQAKLKAFLKKLFGFGDS